ncbi:MAG: ATP-binding protein, partial [Trichodesmium sp. St2_bin2_1]|nr:ATP-binding protein [Trichodesmium sp. St2_bin2_1]
SKNIHIKPNLKSVHFLATYHSLVNAALANELVIEGRIINLKEFEEIIFDSQILNNCSLLQDLSVVVPTETQEKQNELDLDEIKNFVLNLIRKQSFMERNSIIENTLNQFVKIERSKIDIIIAELERANKIKIIAPTSKSDEQLVCFVSG